MEQNNDENDPQQKRSKIYVFAIQVIFSVIIGISFTSYYQVLVPIQVNFEQAMILVAFATVVVSLVGYSITMKSKHHKKFYRFVIDLVLLYLYFQLIYSPLHGFNYFISLFPWIFGLYIVWQYLESIEYSESFSNKIKYSGPTFVGFVIIWGLYQFYPNKIQIISQKISSLEYGSPGIIELIILVTIFVLVMLFRFLYWWFEEKK